MMNELKLRHVGYLKEGMDKPHEINQETEIVGEKKAGGGGVAREKRV